MVRKTVFWIHLLCGVVAGLVVLLMSATGVLLTYERQMVAWAERGLYATPPAEAESRSPFALADAARTHDPNFTATSVTYSSDPRAPATVGAGRSGSLYVNRYTGEVLGNGATGLREFFRAVTGWHRWFNASDDARATARVVTGASNLVFLFLIVSGVYLWLPRVFKWAAFKSRLWFNAKATSSRARDLNWHHVLGLWSAVPLAIVVATAVVFSYGWANDLVYRSFGEAPPERGGRGGPPRAAESATSSAATRALAGATDRAASRNQPSALPVDALLEHVAARIGDWERVTVQLPRQSGDVTELSLSIDRGNGGQPQHRHTLVVDAATGATLDWQPFESQPPGRRARSMIRFLHTGEALGVAGQTLAGLVSLTSIIMVWTGLALAYRRLIVPLLRPRNGRG